MSNLTMESQIKELLEFKRMREELDNEIQAAEDAIKQVMGDEETLLAELSRLPGHPTQPVALTVRASKRIMPNWLRPTPRPPQAVDSL